MNAEQALRAEIVKWGKSFFDRGLTAGSSGNISVRFDGGYVTTPTNSCLGFLNTDALSLLDAKGAHVAGGRPTKELPLHMALYRARADARAVVHLHSTFATIVSADPAADADDALLPVTPYSVMRLGQVPIVPYSRPGSTDAVAAVQDRADRHWAFLLANHGPLVAGTSLDSAAFATEELEQAAKLMVLGRNVGLRCLDRHAIDELHTYFPNG